MRPISSLLALALLSLPIGAEAYTITIDADPVDWVLAAPTNVNTGHIARDAAGLGEYVWTDQAGDEQDAFGGAVDPPSDPRVDITELRVTADETNVYFLVRMTDIDLAAGDGAPQVQIAVDRTGVTGDGEEWFAAWADTQVNPEAAWEYLVMTRFGSSEWIDQQPVVYM